MFEQQIARELEAIAPDAVPIFREATAAWDARDPASALDLYSRVLERAPGFSHAERRKCGALVQLHRFAEGIPLCRAALAQDDSPQNQGALAMSLLAMAGDTGEAMALAVRASTAKPDEPYYWEVLAQAAFTAGDLPTARRASERLLTLAPDEPMTSFYAAVVAADDGDEGRAAALLARAKADGPDEKRSPYSYVCT